MDSFLLKNKVNFAIFNPSFLKFFILVGVSLQVPLENQLHSQKGVTGFYFSPVLVKEFI